MRQPIIAANWKMNMDLKSSREYVLKLKGLCSPQKELVLICPPFTMLHLVGQLLAGSPFVLGGQDVFWQESGSYTGEISPTMLREVGCQWVIVGHSERRRILHETDEMISKKVEAALKNGLRVIVCVGETLEERDRGEGPARLRTQVEAALALLGPERSVDVVVAYEPVWAIGTGKAASVEDAVAAARLIRETIAAKWGSEPAESVRVLYGGSVNPTNAAGFARARDIDGTLVGGASLNPSEFSRIVQAWQG
ncbi:MAG TPA: triose-phosphate isomerase [Firmicutes bacterium]|nr:triose-phosphate isomerase [Bacillota bacterium]